MARVLVAFLSFLTEILSPFFFLLDLVALRRLKREPTVVKAGSSFLSLSSLPSPTPTAPMLVSYTLPWPSVDGVAAARPLYVKFQSLRFYIKLAGSNIYSALLRDGCFGLLRESGIDF